MILVTKTKDETYFELRFIFSVKTYWNVDLLQSYGRKKSSASDSKTL